MGILPAGSSVREECHVRPVEAWTPGDYSKTAAIPKPDKHTAARAQPPDPASIANPGQGIREDLSSLYDGALEDLLRGSDLVVDSAEPTPMSMWSSSQRSEDELR
jgi:hypothetical protein